MKEEKTKSKKRLIYYVLLAVCVLLLAAATVLTVYFVTESGNNTLDTDPDDTDIVDGGQDDDPASGGDQTGGQDEDPDDEPTTGGDVLAYVSPIDGAAYTLEYGDCYANATLGWYYRHYAVDLTAEAGTEVCAMAAGTVQSISYNESTGNYIVVDHGDGLCSLYRYVTPVDGLAVGDEVAAGETIATVDEANGAEAADGDHLHFEVTLNGQNVDPTVYIELTLTEK